MFDKIKESLLKFPTKMKDVNNDDTVAEYRAFEELHQFTEYSVIGGFVSAGQGNVKDLYMLTRKLSGKFQQSNMPIRDREGQMLMTTEQ